VAFFATKYKHPKSLNYKSQLTSVHLGFKSLLIKTQKTSTQALGFFEFITKFIPVVNSPVKMNKTLHFTMYQ